MSEKQPTNSPRFTNRTQRWLIGAAYLTLVLLIGGVIYVKTPSHIQRAVEKAGGIYKVHEFKRPPHQILSDLLNGGTRQQPFHFIDFNKVPVDDNWLHDHQTALSNATHL